MLENATITETSKRSDRADTVVVLDFETTGLSPLRGDRAIEIGAVRIVKGQITERFQQLMNPGRRISSFIEDYTGISNAMLADSPPCETVMAQFADFLGEDNLVAHNASFDQRFLEAELARVKKPIAGSFGCSMLLSRRIYPDAPSHRLGSLVAYKKLPNDGVFHRALADSEMTAHLWLNMLEDIAKRYPNVPQSFMLMQKVMKTPKGSLPRFWEAASAWFG